jgi:hypothetical protein
MSTRDRLLKTNPKTHINNRREKRNGPKGVLQFPANLGAHGTLMRFFEYTYGGAKGSVEFPLAEIMLPLPKQIQDSFKVNVTGDELGVTGAAAAGIAASGGDVMKVGGKLAKAAGGAVKGAGAAFWDAITGDTAAIKEGLAKTADAAGFLVAAGLGKVAPDTVNGIGAGRGTAVNPFATLVFKGVDLKVHSLEWLLSPETEAESEELKKIIRTLQRMVLPKTDSPIGDTATGMTAVDKGILRYPAMVNIYLQGIDANYYFKFKTSMISQLNIDYSPNGVAPLKGGKPSAIGITMTLNEAYIHTAADNDQESLEEEGRAEQIASQDEDGTGNPRTLGVPSEPFNDPNTRYSDQLASDEVSITRTNADGSVQSTVALRSDVAQALGGDEIVDALARTDADTNVKITLPSE